MVAFEQARRRPAWHLACSFANVMPQAITRQFGALEYEESAVLTFPAGLAGFESQTRFVLVDRAELAPLVFLQSLDCADLCFPAAPIAAIDRGYALSLSPEDLTLLDMPSQHEFLCLAILAATETGRWTANLLAPVVVNLKTRLAVQAVRADRIYSHQQPIGKAECS